MYPTRQPIASFRPFRVVISALMILVATAVANDPPEGNEPLVNELPRVDLFLTPENPDAEFPGEGVDNLIHPRGTQEVRVTIDKTGTVGNANFQLSGDLEVDARVDETPNNILWSVADPIDEGEQIVQTLTITNTAPDEANATATVKCRWVRQGGGGGGGGALTGTASYEASLEDSVASWQFETDLTVYSAMNPTPETSRINFTVAFYDSACRILTATQITSINYTSHGDPGLAPAEFTHFDYHITQNLTPTTHEEAGSIGPEDLEVGARAVPVVDYNDGSAEQSEAPSPITSLPIEMEIIHSEIDPRTNEIVSPGDDAVLRDEIVDLRIRLRPIDNQDWIIDLDVDPAEMRSQELGGRGDVLMFDFGTIENDTVTPLTASGERYTIDGPYQIVLRAMDDGEATIRAVFNREGVIRLSLELMDGAIEILSQDITVIERIRKYAIFTAAPDHDPNQHDTAFEDAFAHWAGIYEHEVDTVDRLKAMGMAESYLGFNPTAPIDRPNDILSIGNPGDDVMNTLTNVAPFDQLPTAGEALREVDIPNNTTKMLSYPDASVDTANMAILYGVCWLYQKAARIYNNPNPPPPYIPGPWHTWDDATWKYNGHQRNATTGQWDGGGVENYLERVHRPLHEGLDPFTPIITLWPRLTNDQPRREMTE